LLAVYTNEDPTNPNQIVLTHIKNIVLGSTTAPSTANSNAFTYKITFSGDFGDSAGLYSVAGLMSDPTNPYIAYLFV